MNKKAEKCNLKWKPLPAALFDPPGGISLNRLYTFGQSQRFHVCAQSLSKSSPRVLASDAIVISTSCKGLTQIRKDEKVWRNQILMCRQCRKCTSHPTNIIYSIYWTHTGPKFIDFSSCWNHRARVNWWEKKRLNSWSMTKYNSWCVDSLEGLLSQATSLLFDAIN